MTFGLLLAAGKGSRFGGAVPKQFVDLAGQPVVVHSLEVFERADCIDSFGLLVPRGGSDEFEQYVDTSVYKKCEFVTSGGNSRRESVKKGLRKIGGVATEASNTVAVHDTARPAVTVEFLKDIVQKFEKSVECVKGVIPGLPVRDTVKRVQNSSGRELVSSTVDREGLRKIQTPQIFSYTSLLRAHEDWSRGQKVTDDAMMLEQLDEQIQVTRGREKNLKLTYRRDLELLEFYLKDNSVGRSLG